MKRQLLFFFTLLLSSFIWAQKPTVQIRFAELHIVVWPVNTAYKDPGCLAFDSAGNNYGQYVIRTGSVDTSTIGTYQLVYSITDSIANAIPKTRTVKIADGSPPVIQLLGQPVMTSFDTVFVEPGFKLTDNYYPDSILRGLLTIAHSTNIKVAGSSYILLDNGPGWVSYHLTDPSGNKADSAVRFFQTYWIGIAETVSSLFALYPNPAANTVNIQSELQLDKCVLVDLSGKTYPLFPEKTATGFALDISSQEAGMYIMILESNGQQHHSRLEITHDR